MTNEEKELLLKDLCARILYGVKFMCNGNVHVIKGVDLIVTDEGDWEYAVIAKGIAPIEINFVKPYLRRMSNMTEEEAKVYDEISHHLCGEITAKTMIYFLNARHFDYNNLIEKGLAIEAPERMYE